MDLLYDIYTLVNEWMGTQSNGLYSVTNLFYVWKAIRSLTTVTDVYPVPLLMAVGVVVGVTSGITKAWP